MAVGFIYKQTQDIVDRVETSEILQRLAALEQRTGKNSVAPEVLADALLGAIQPPNEKSVTVSQTFDIYLKEIVFSELFNKSKEQRRAWTKTKQTSIDYFINVIGDMKISDIERSHALKYKKWWRRTIMAKQHTKEFQVRSLPLVQEAVRIALSSELYRKGRLRTRVNKSPQI